MLCLVCKRKVTYMQMKKGKAVCFSCEKALSGFPKKRSKGKDSREDRKRKFKVEVINKAKRPREMIEEWKRDGEWHLSEY